MNVYDQAARFAAKLDPGGFLRWLLAGFDPDLTFTRWLETQTIPFPGEPDRRCDTVAELVPASGLAPPWAAIIEFQTRPDTEMPYRLLEYLGRLGRELRHGPHGRDRYQLAAAVVNLTGTGVVVSVEMVLPGEAGPELRFRPRARNLREVSAAETLAGIASGAIARCLLPWVPLMDGGDTTESLAEWKRLAAPETNRRLRAEYGGLALQFAELAGCRVEWDKLLEDWNMEESQVVAEWMAKGLAKGRREDLLRILSLRFPGPLPSEMIAVIQSESDAGRLSHWLDEAVRCDSLEHFQATLKVAG
jgi:hypothetical protein